MTVYSISAQTIRAPVPSDKNDNGGAIMRAGAVSTGSALVDDVALGLSSRRDVNSVQLAASLGTAKAVSAGAFQYETERQFTIMKSSTTIGGVANTVLLTGSSIPGLRKRIAAVGSVRTQFLRSLTWDSNGVDLPVYSFTVDDHNVTFWSISAGAVSATADDAAFSVTTAGKLNGEITYRDGSFIPVNDAYHTQE